MSKLTTILFALLFLICKETVFAQGQWNAGATQQDKVTATLSKGTLTISGSGKMKDYKTGWPYDFLENDKPPWNDFKESIEKIIIENGVTSIGTGTFRWNKNLTSVTISSSVTSIGDDAFSGCGLISIAIPDNVKSIGIRAFSYCAKLKSIDIPSGVTSIGMYAFMGCDSLKSVTIPSSVKSFGFTPFYICKNLTSITILNPTPPLINNDLFRGMKKANCTLYVPKGSEEAYRSAEFWNYFKNIKAIE